MKWEARLVPKSIMTGYQELTSFDLVKENKVFLQVHYNFSSSIRHSPLKYELTVPSGIPDNTENNATTASILVSGIT